MTNTIITCGSCRTIHHPRAGKAAHNSSPAPVCAPLRSVTRATVAALSQNNSGIAAAITATIVACVRPRKINSANVRMKLRQLDLVAIRIGQQRDVARALDCGRQLTLITRLRPCDTAWNDFTGFGNVAFQSLDIFVIDLFYTFCTEAAELTTAKETCHDLILFSNLNLTMGLSCDRTHRSRCCRLQPRLRLRGRLQS